MLPRDFKGLEIAKGVRYYTVQLYAFQLGCTIKQFRLMLKALGVPTVRMFGREYVQHQAFVVAMAAIGMVGEPNFWGAEPGTRNHKMKKGCKTKLDYKTELEPKMDLVIAHILYGARVSGLSTDVEALTMIKENLKDLRLRVTTAQAAYEKLALKQAEDVLNPIPERILSNLEKFVKDNAPSDEQTE